MSNIESELELENRFIAFLESLDYERVSIRNEKELERNLKAQLEIHNSTTLSDSEFNRILLYLEKGTSFEKAKKLRDKYELKKDNLETEYIEFLNSEHWCQNIFQVTNQVTVKGRYKNRYDVTILINGLPLVQIELKRSGVELKEAFNQINRYKAHSYGANKALFKYIQIFIISNKGNTKYYTNSNSSFKQTFFWAKRDNKPITDLFEFSSEFLERCHLSKMICKYIVLSEPKKRLMILRPYQYYAVESIIDRVQNSNKNGYIWHTTGSGKTLTSFKASQILTKLRDIKKVVFVVDRKDLDYQTIREFNSFSEGSIDGTDDTKTLVNQFLGKYERKKGELVNSDLIITTIQKLNTAISKKRYLEQMESLKDEKIVFIFDECHRSQFGKSHISIKKFFTNAQMIGFTGTPIFSNNSISNQLGKRTTKDLFDECLHKYVIVDAIRDENVLKFSIEYLGKYKEKINNLDIAVENIDKKEVLESSKRVNKIIDYIIANHDRKTHNKSFNAILCVSSVDVLIKYYESFKEKEHNLKIATIFSYGANEEALNDDGIIDEVDISIESDSINNYSRDKLEEFISDYNSMFGSNFSTKDTKSFYNYYQDVSKKVREQEVDILLVVNMFLTGFDSPTLNTIYVDKNLKYHGLIQSFSRTNRILNEKKSQGNIVCFRNLKTNTDEAITLFSNKDAKEIILMESYEQYLEKIKIAIDNLKSKAPTVSSIDSIIDEEEQLEFIKSFREVIRLKNRVESFTDFEWEDITIEPQEFEDYKSKYLDLYDRVKNYKEDNKVSILDDIDFEVELIQKDEINVSYILKLLKNLKESNKKDKDSEREAIANRE